MSCHVVHKNIGPMVIDFDDYQPRLDSAWQSRAERSFPVHTSLSWASSSPPELCKAEMAPVNSALTLTVPGTAFSRAQVRPQHLLSGVGTLGRGQGLPGSVAVYFSYSWEPNVACSKPRLARCGSEASVRLSLPACVSLCAVAPR